MRNFRASTRSLVALIVVVTLLPHTILATSHEPAPASPPGCQNNGFSITLRILKADGITTHTGPLQAGERVFYRTTLAWAGGSNCHFEDGAVTTRTPDGVWHAAGDVGRVDGSTSFRSSPVAYTVRVEDVAQGRLPARSQYDGGHALDGGDSPIAGAVGVSSLFEPVALSLTTTATPAYERACAWGITKAVAPQVLTLVPGSSGTVEYTVGLERACDDVAHRVSGTVLVQNPARAASAHVAQVDAAIEGVPAPLSCAASLPLILAPGASVACTYGAATAARSGLVAATATVEAGTDVAGNSGSSAFTFEGVAPTSVALASVHVDDTLEGPLGTVGATTTITYPRTFTCGSGEGELSGFGNVIPNTASIRETGAQAVALVTVHCGAPPATCTATPLRVAAGRGEASAWNAVAVSATRATPGESATQGEAQLAGATVTLPRVTNGGLSVGGTVEASALHSRCDSLVEHAGGTATSEAGAERLRVLLDVQDALGQAAALELTAGTLRADGESIDAAATLVADIHELRITGVVGTVPIAQTLVAGPVPENHEVPLEIQGSSTTPLAPDVRLGLIVLNARSVTTDAATGCVTHRAAALDLFLDDPLAPPTALADLSVGEVVVSSCPRGPTWAPATAWDTCSASAALADVTTKRGVDSAWGAATRVAVTGLERGRGGAHADAASRVDGVALGSGALAGLRAETLASSCASNEASTRGTAGLEALELALELPAPGGEPVSLGLRAAAVQSVVEGSDGAWTIETTLAAATLTLNGEETTLEERPAPNTVLASVPGVFTLLANRQRVDGSGVGADALVLIVYDPDDGAQTLVIVLGRADAAT